MKRRVWKRKADNNNNNNNNKFKFKLEFIPKFDSLKWFEMQTIQKFFAQESSKIPWHSSLQRARTGNCARERKKCPEAILRKAW